MPVLDHHRDRVEVRAAVGVHHALRPPGRPRGVVDRQGVLLVREPRVDRGLLAPGEEVLERGAELDAPHRGRHARRLRRELRRVEEQGGPGVLDDVAHVVGGEPRVDGDQDRAGLGDPEVRQQHRFGVHRQERDPVVLSHAGAAERGRQAPRARAPLAVGERSAPVCDGDAVRVHVARPLKEHHGRQLLPVDCAHGIRPRTARRRGRRACARRLRCGVSRSRSSSRPSGAAVRSPRR